MTKLLLALTFVISTVYATEHRRKVVVIDTGVGWHQDEAPFLCKDGTKTVLKTDVYDNHGHGLNIIGIIAKKLDFTKWCIVSIKYHDPNHRDNFENFLKALELAMTIPNVGMINLSVEGPQESYVELGYYQELIKRGVVINVAAGNHNLNLDQQCYAFPACYKRILKSNLFRVIGGKQMEKTNKGSIITDWRPAVKQGFPKMTGTSQATAIFTADQAK